MTPEGQGTLPDQEDDQKAEQPSEAERKSNLTKALDAIDDELGPKEAKQSDPVQIHGYAPELPGDTDQVFLCECGARRFIQSFYLGHPAAYRYNLRYSCISCHKPYTHEQVMAALDAKQQKKV